MNSVNDDVFTDLRGLKCPEPLLLLRKAMREVPGGRVLHVVATDTTTERDFAQFCRFLEHELLERWQDVDELHYRIRKNPRAK